MLRRGRARHASSAAASHLLSTTLSVTLAAILLSSAPLASVQARSWIGDIQGTGPDHTVYTRYVDTGAYRGNYAVLVTNSGSEPWGDFHFKIFDPVGGQNISNVGFLDAPAGGEDPTSSQSGLSWVIDNNSVGATIDLLFCSDPVMPGETAWFSIYISNPDHISFFGVAFYPSPVPPQGACCFPDGSCALTCETDCKFPGTWHGEWTICDPDPCPQPPPKGACCDPVTGDCTFIVQAECQPDHWIPGYSCTPTTPCKAPDAACCDLQGRCTVAPQEQCLPPSVWYPNDPSCDPNNCPQTVPSKSTTWGGIKATYR